MASQDDHDTLPEETAGFKVGEKKTLNEIQNMGKWFYCVSCRSLDTWGPAPSPEPRTLHIPFCLF